MFLIVASESDEASMNIRHHLLEMRGWEEKGEFEGYPALAGGDRLLVTIKGLHLYEDDIDLRVQRALGVRVSTVAYASKHQSTSGRRSFTVHPIGNWAQAEYGGRPGVLVPSAPEAMTSALRLLRRKGEGLGYTISFEATHHGPYLSTPSFFIEAGSDLGAWEDPLAGRAIAETLVGLEPEDFPVAIGIGGGHYAPRISEVALARRIAFGHILSSHDCPEVGEDLLHQAVTRTPGAELVYFHRKVMDKPLVRRLEDWFGSQGLRVVREDDLQPLGG
jgi:D-aminoacyl-tRNA deacylase